MLVPHLHVDRLGILEGACVQVIINGMRSKDVAFEGLLLIDLTDDFYSKLENQRSVIEGLLAGYHDESHTIHGPKILVFS